MVAFSFITNAQERSYSERLKEAKKPFNYLRVDKMCFRTIATAIPATVATPECRNPVFSRAANATFATVATPNPVNQGWAESSGVCRS